MSRRNATGRHRSAGRAKTPLTGLTAAVQANAGVIGRRSAVFAASSGLAMTMGIPAANADKGDSASGAKTTEVIVPSATPEQTTGNASSATPSDISTPAPAQTAEVAVPAEVIINLEEATVTKATPPPAAAAVLPAVPETVDARRGDRPNRSNTPTRNRPTPERATPATPARPVTETPSNRRPATPATPATPKPVKKPVKKAPVAKKPVKKAPVSSSKKRAQIMSIAARYVGVPYRWGGTTPRGFDCSGYVQYVFKQAGISLPRTSGAQAKAGRRIPASQARPGDLVWKPKHIGIYAGNGMMYDAPRSGKSIVKRKIWFKPVYIRVIK